ncbi:MAG: ATP-binding protein, partial [Verrucomicrobia bacterium]|nr:ATP-binding protein [Verrucomicrobiota bacterium]
MGMFYGREEERATLQKIYQSKTPEFVALYGRRRVGKTYLVRNAFSRIKDGLFFYVTGTKNGKLSEQIQNFTEEIGNTFIQQGLRLEVKKNWRDTFRLLTDQIQASTKKKIVLFFDEFPWMVTRKSALLQTLEYFWNRHWSTDPRVKLIICGSSSGWILKHIINNTEGLYNRVTERIHLEPFNLQQTKGYLLSRRIKLTDKQIADLYMVLGGIPHYLDQIKSGLSTVQIVEELAFKKKGFLVTEFKNLYATLFGTADGHVELARIISKHHYGIGQDELAEKSHHFKSGGRLSDCLEDLIEAGFIERFTPFTHKKKGITYKMTDEYSLFYFRWIEPIKETLLDKGMRKGYWEGLQRSSAWQSWAGYAFESLCYKHIPQISIALDLSPTAIPYAWHYISVRGSEDSGSQIDLLFDRDDNVITVCEIKYTEKPFEID